MAHIIIKQMMVVCVVFLILYVSCSDIRDKWRIESETVGEFMVDFSISEVYYTKEELEYYNGTTFILRKDRSFEFSKPVPQNKGTIGTWEVGGSKLERNLILTYGNGSQIQIGNCGGVNCIIDIRIPIYNGNILVGSKNLFFRRKSEIMNKLDAKYK